MKCIFLILFYLAFSQNVMSQSDTLFLLIEKPYIQGKIDTNYKFGFIINSDDKRFVCDYYEFSIHSYQGWDEEGNDVYVSLKDLRKKVKIDTLKYETISSLSKEKNGGKYIIT